MRSKIVFGAVVFGLVAFVYAMTLAPRPATAGDGKNLKILSKSLDKKQIKKVMKTISKAVGKSCDDCHDLDDFSKDMPMKETAREMFRLTNSINAKLKKDGFKKKINCRTCHRGEEKPKK